MFVFATIEDGEIGMVLGDAADVPASSVPRLAQFERVRVRVYEDLVEAIKSPLLGVVGLFHMGPGGDLTPVKRFPPAPKIGIDKFDAEALKEHGRLVGLGEYRAWFDSLMEMWGLSDAVS